MKRKLLALFAVASLLAVACGKTPEPDPVPTPDPVDDYDATITLTTEEITVDASEGSTGIFRITVDHEWSIELPEDADWLSVDIAEGGVCKNKKITFTAKANTGKPRTAVGKVVSGKNSSKFSVVQKAPSVVLKSSDVPDYDKYYLPDDSGLGIPKTKEAMLSSDSRWSFVRSKQSEHFIVFWDKQYGEYGLYGKQVGEADTWPTTEANTAMRVDIDDLLTKAEQFFNTNVNVLKMAELGVGKSYLDKYKMQIYLIWQDEWLATGSGYGNTIGALWVNPSTCQPVGSTIAHEIGHSFQYQVYCDKIAQGGTDDQKSGFRYGFVKTSNPGSSGGNAYWEQCAQWQSFQDYPGQILGGSDINVWLANYHRHFHHEWMRYASYYFQYYLTAKYGIDAYVEIWRQAQYQEDAIMVYNRVFNGGDWEQTRKDLYDYAAHVATFDIPGVREYGAENHQNRYKTSLIETSDGWYQVAYASCPGSTGFNVIRLDVPESGKVTVNFKGLASDSNLAEDDAGQYRAGEEANVVGTRTKYNGTVSADNLGWRYGFVAVDASGNRYYGEMNSDREGVVEYQVPVNAQNLYFIVQGCPKTYSLHGWDDKELNDEQFPYMVKFEGTDLFGNIKLDRSAGLKDIEFVYDVTYKASSGDYVQGSKNLSDNGDLAKLAQAFLLQPYQITSKTQSIASGSTASVKEGMVTFGLLQPDGTIKYNYSANVGFYITKDGKVGSWSNNDPVFVEYDKDNFVLSYGHKPGTTAAGDKFTVKPCLVYRKGGKTYKAVFTFNITVE